MISEHLVQTENKYWVPKEREQEIVSYPDKHDFLYEIEEQSFWFQHRNQCILQAIKKHPPLGMFYDIGGGNRYVSMAIQNAGYDVTLIEPYEKGAYNAVRRGISTVICSTLQNTGIPLQTIPAIGIFDVLEHIEDDVSYLKELNDYLIDDGKLYITVPSYQFLWSKIDEESGHYRRHTLAGLNNRLINSGFEVVYQTYFFSLLPLPIYFFRTFPGKLNIGRSQNTKKEHINPYLRHFTNVYSKIELSMLKKMTLPFGGSCLVVAQKRKTTK